MHATYLKKRRKKYESILVCMQLRKRQRTCIDRTFSLDVEHIISVNDALYVVTALHTEPLRLTMVKGHHNWICAAYPHFVCCYRSEMLAQCAQLLLTSAWSFVAPLLLLFFSVILFCWKKYLKSTENLFSSFSVGKQIFLKTENVLTSVSAANMVAQREQLPLTSA